jgi:hypothetical protein
VLPCTRRAATHRRRAVLKLPSGAPLAADMAGMKAPLLVSAPLPGKAELRRHPSRHTYSSWVGWLRQRHDQCQIFLTGPMVFHQVLISS